MAVGDLTIAYSTTSVVFDQFSGDDLPRAYVSQASLDFSILGAGYSSGPARRQRKIWTVAAYATTTQCSTLLNIFNAWDNARATGSNLAEVDITDELFGSTVTAKGFFTDPPVITKVSGGNNRLFLITFALTET